MARFNFEDITLQDSADITKVMDNFNKIEENGATLEDVTAIDIVHRGTLIPDNSDLNNYMTPGGYYSPAGESTQTIKNIPQIKVAFKLTVAQLHLPNRLLQKIVANTPQLTIYYRVYTGSWGDWYKINVGPEPIRYVDIEKTISFTANTDTSARFNFSAPTGYSVLLANTIDSTQQNGLQMSVVQLTDDYVVIGFHSAANYPNLKIKVRVLFLKQ